MKRFILTLVFCASLLCVLSSFLFRSAVAAENPLLALLNLPAPPPPNPQVSLPTDTRGENFFSKDKPPPDDEPIESLMEYWRAQSESYNELQYKVFPSEKALARILREIEKDPSKLGEFVNILPRNESSAKFVKEIYDKSAGSTGPEREQRGRLKNWLKYHTAHYSAELANEAGRVSDANDYVTNHRALIALARVDWDRASSIVNRLYNNPGQPASRAAALWALYVHAIEASPSDTDRYRDELKEIVSDKSLSAGVRDLALDALSLEKEWDGRDEWYVSLMEDETLTDLGRFTGLTTLISNSPDAKYIDRMIALLDSENINVRSAAAQNLLDRINSSREVIVKALTRWLENPKWLKQTSRSGRQTLVQSLSMMKAPDSVPGLIAALDEKEMRPATPRYGSNANMNSNASVGMQGAVNALARAANTAGYAANSANAAGIATEVAYPLRYFAIEALSFQKDPRAVPTLRRILNENTEPYGNHGLVKAIYECGGFSIGEQVTAVESAARAAEELAANAAAVMAANAKAINAASVVTASELSLYDKDGEPTRDVARMLGAILVSRSDVADDLARAVIGRIDAVERTDPDLANGLRRILLAWKGAAVNALLLRDLKNNKVSVDAVVRLLAERKLLRENQMSDVSDLRTGGAVGVAISSCLLEDPNEYEGILESSGDETKTAFLACARLIRAPLPVDKVAKNLQSKDKLLALAAERYLESEDSPYARQVVLSRHAGEARILGATTAFYPAESHDQMSRSYLMELFATVSAFHARPRPYYGGYDESTALDVEKGLQDEVKRRTDLLGIYNWEPNTIRIYKDQAVLSWQDDPARYRERVLTGDEFQNFKDLLAHHKADELPPFLACTGEGCESRELLMLGRNGGRRLFVKASSMPPLFAELDSMFEEMRRPPSVIKYLAGRDVPGLELLFADDRLDAKAVWKSGADFRLLTADKIRRGEIDVELENFAENLPEGDDEDEDELVPMYGEDARLAKERSRREYENFAWNNFAAGAIGSPAAQPSQVGFIPMKDALEVPGREDSWKAKAGSVEIRADDRGLYKIVAGKLTKIKTGQYAYPVITPNGRWVVATKYDDAQGPQLVRVNLITNKQFTVQSQELPIYRAVAYVASVNRVLVGAPREEYEDYEGESSSDDDGSGYSLLDPETGSLIPARGDVKPLIQQTFRPLQTSASGLEFWAAIPKEGETVIGLYNTRNFNLKPLLKLPKISFDSMAIWADESEGKVYFVYEGHLLSVPVKTRP